MPDFERDCYDSLVLKEEQISIPDKANIIQTFILRH